MSNESKHNEYVITSFFFKKKKHMIVRDEYDFVKNKKGNDRRK